MTEPAPNLEELGAITDQETLYSLLRYGRILCETPDCGAICFVDVDIGADESQSSHFMVELVSKPGMSRCARACGAAMMCPEETNNSLF